MKKEYDVKKLKVKRRGVLPGLKGQSADSAKIKITISLDKDVVDYFKSEADKPGAFPYQTQINQALRSLIGRWHQAGSHEDIELLKKELLSDPGFIKQVVKLVARNKQASK
jgi:uncharacterized protein (DUF4415 family)